MASDNSDTVGQPLFIVDRDWLRQGPKVRKSWTGNVRNRSLYGLAIEVNEDDILRKGTRKKARINSRRKRRERQEPAVESQNENVHASLELLAAQNHPSAPLEVIQDSRFAVARNGPSAMIVASANDSWQDDTTLPPSLFSNPNGFGIIKGLEQYLDYCMSLPTPIQQLES